MKLRKHSAVDVITNSSTEIYISFEGVQEVTRMAEELLKLVGDDRDVDEVFIITRKPDLGHAHSIFMFNELCSEDRETVPQALKAFMDAGFVDNYNSFVTSATSDEESMVWLRQAEDIEGCSLIRRYELDMRSTDAKYNNMVQTILDVVNNTHSAEEYDN